MEINVNLDPEQINRAVAEAIINSAIGVQLKKVIEEQVQKLSRTWDSPIERVVNEEIVKQLRQIIETEHKQRIEEIVRNKLAADGIDKIFDALWNTIYNKYR